MSSAFAIDYAGGLATLGESTYEAIVATLSAELPPAWLARYERMCTGPTNVLAVAAKGFDYLFDYSADLIARGLLQPSPDCEDRVVAAFGRSEKKKQRRTSATSTRRACDLQVISS
jgi:hypothetical protein